MFTDIPFLIVWDNIIDFELRHSDNGSNKKYQRIYEKEFWWWCFVHPSIFLIPVWVLLVGFSSRWYKTMFSVIYLCNHRITNDKQSSDWILIDVEFLLKTGTRTKKIISWSIMLVTKYSGVDIYDQHIRDMRISKKYKQSRSKKFE